MLVPIRKHPKKVPIVDKLRADGRYVGLELKTGLSVTGLDEFMDIEGLETILLRREV